MLRFFVLVFVAFVYGCQPSSGPVSPELHDCSRLSSESDWLILGQTTPAIEPVTSPLRLSTGQSHTVSLWPPIGNECASSYSISWSAEDQTVASVLPRPDRNHVAWVTGVSPGSTRVLAQISFLDGLVQEVYRGVSVSPPEPPPPGSIVVAQGELDLDPENSALPPDPRSFIHFTTDAEGRLEALVHWISPLNGVGPVVYAGHCRSRGCGRIVLQFNSIGAKPLSDSRNMVPPGDFTLYITVGGSETVRYLVRLTPG